MKVHRTDVTVQRFFAVAPLIPCDEVGRTDREPAPSSYRAAQYGDGFLTLAEALPQGAEFYIGGSQDAPEWARTAFDNLHTLVGAMTGVVVYRVSSSDEIYCDAFVEMIGDEPVIPTERWGEFQAERYAEGSLFAHDAEVSITSELVLAHEEVSSDRQASNRALNA